MQSRVNVNESVTNFIYTYGLIVCFTSLDCQCQNWKATEVKFTVELEASQILYIGLLNRPEETQLNFRGIH